LKTHRNTIETFVRITKINEKKKKNTQAITASDDSLTGLYIYKKKQRKNRQNPIKSIKNQPKVRPYLALVAVLWRREAPDLVRNQRQISTNGRRGLDQRTVLEKQKHGPARVKIKKQQ
jgi:hypothetical protein